MSMQHVSGKNAGKVMIYTLSTCPWCKKIKNLLNDMGVEYDYIDVDLEPSAEKKEIIKNVEKWNPEMSFPTIVINEKKALVGYNEKEIRESLKMPVKT